MKFSQLYQRDAMWRWFNKLNSFVSNFSKLSELKSDIKGSVLKRLRVFKNSKRIGH